MNHSRPSGLATCVGLICLALIAWGGVGPAAATERVRFESARYLAGPLQQRLARERGETPAPPAADIINGYLTKPDGDGPFPAVVHLHGCSGLSAEVRSGAVAGVWPERLAAWGYVVLVVDSFTSRGIAHTCIGPSAPRVADAYGALAFLARQPFVAPGRIAVMGFSQGAIAALAAVEQRDFQLFEHEDGQTFRAAVAFYPECSSDGDMRAPTLILIGDADDWTSASACRRMMARRKGSGSPVTLMVYPGAYHGFDAPALQPGRRSFGHWLEYDAAAAQSAAEEVRRFLAANLAR